MKYYSIYHLGSRIAFKNPSKALKFCEVVGISPAKNITTVRI